MKLTFTPEGWSDHLHWQATDRKILKRVNDVIKDVQRSPFEGIGKPEALRENWSGWWSRRITEEHRLVYRVVEEKGEQRVEVARCRFYYSR